jgi:molecular chaperone GrpE
VPETNKHAPAGGFEERPRGDGDEHDDLLRGDDAGGGHDDGPILEVEGSLLGNVHAEAGPEPEPEAERDPESRSEPEAESADERERREREQAQRERELAEREREFAERERELSEELAAARAEAKQHLDDLRRLKAEFENFRKRTQRDQGAARASAASALVTRLLPVLDNFELAISSAEHSQDFEKMLKGVEMVSGELREVLRSEGVAEIAAEGEPFDPQRHEAVVAVEAEDVEPGTVVAVVRTGYELQGKVLRPAMVKVAQ